MSERFRPEENPNEAARVQQLVEDAYNGDHDAAEEILKNNDGMVVVEDKNVTYVDNSST